MREASPTQPQAVSDEVRTPTMPTALRSRNPIAWLALFGPGAVIASLTIGAGELIFSTRGGALFGYRLLFSFLVITVLKWALVFVTARHMVLTGMHPFQRWAELPGPRGWLPLVFLALALAAFPIWVGFHAGTLGTLVAFLTGTAASMNGGAHLLWGIACLAGVWLLAQTGGYHRLERVQLGMVLLMLGCVAVSLVLLKPDWISMVHGLLIPQPLAYPEWAAEVPAIASRPVWVELATYIGVVGGSGYDYLAYLAYLREKPWGRTAGTPRLPSELQRVAEDPAHPDRAWIRAPLIDCSLSFAAVLLFSAVFVAGGTLVLGPQHKVPAGGDLLTLQAEFVTASSDWLRPFYFTGALLTMVGTLYGTIEVAPAVLREILVALDRVGGSTRQRSARTWAIAWVSIGGIAVLLMMWLFHLLRGGGQPPGLIAILTPANLFTGVLACGIIGWLAAWTDRRHLPPALRPAPWLTGLNLLGGGLFLGIGVKSYWDDSRWAALPILIGTVALGWFAALWHERHPGDRSPGRG